MGGLAPCWAGSPPVVVALLLVRGVLVVFRVAVVVAALIRLLF